jgi:transposase/DNA-binding CsgD family transcriptional regulator
MGKPYSMDLREREVAAVLRDGLSRHESAARFGVAPSTVIIGWGGFGRRGASHRARWAGISPRRSPASTRPFWRGGSGTGPSPCAGWWPNWLSAGLRSIIGRCGILFTPRSSASKKTVVASERDRPDMARRRAQWTKRQSGIDPKRLVFIDETWTKTNMEPLRGWAPRGERLMAKVPHGHWRTMTFVAALRHDRIAAPWLIDGPIDGQGFRTYVEKALAPTLKPGDVVIMDNLGSHKGEAVRQAIRSAGAKLVFLPKYSPDLNPIEQVFAKLKHLLRKVAARTLDTVVAAIGELLDAYTAEECANSFVNAGYAQA